MATLLSILPISPFPQTCNFPTKSRKPRAVLDRPSRMRVPYHLKQGQSRLFHQLPSGLGMEVIFQKGTLRTDSDEEEKSGPKNPPLVFIHGSFHAAWCWAEHWLPFFSGSGFDCYALSLLGQDREINVGRDIDTCNLQGNGFDPNLTRTLLHTTDTAISTTCIHIHSKFGELMNYRNSLEGLMKKEGVVTVALFKTMFEDCGLKFLNSCLKASVIFLGAIFLCLCLFYIALVHGQGESDLPAGPAAGTLQTHASDVADFIQKQLTSPPVLLGHSFGGLIVQYYISNMITGHLSKLPGREGSHPTLSGAVLVCSVPPSGNSGLVWRYLLSKPIAAFKVTLSLAAKAFATSLPLCKETFFSAEMEEHLVQRYQELLKESSRIPLFDLKKLNASLPPPSVPKNSVQILVMGASDDFIVDAEGLAETAQFYGVSPECMEGVAHDMMLDVSWEKGAQVILSWLNDLNKLNIW